MESQSWDGSGKDVSSAWHDSREDDCKQCVRCEWGHAREQGCCRKGCSEVSQDGRETTAVGICRRTRDFAQVLRRRLNKTRDLGRRRRSRDGTHSRILCRTRRHHVSSWTLETPPCAATQTRDWSVGSTSLSLSRRMAVAVVLQNRTHVKTKGISECFGSPRCLPFANFSQSHDRSKDH